MNDFVEGIVLSSNEYREYDGILTVSTKDYGVLKVIARGIRKMNSKNASACLPFTHMKMYIHVAEHKTLHALQRTEIVQSHRHIREDLVKQSIASFFCECIEKSEDGLEVFDILEKALFHLEEGDCLLTLCIFTATMMQMHGIEPFVDGCVHCRRQQRICGISIKNGGFVCQNCFSLRYDVSLQKEQLRKLRYLCKANFQYYEVLSSKIKCEAEDFERLYTFFNEYAGISLRSFCFLKQLLHMV